MKFTPLSSYRLPLAVGGFVAMLASPCLADPADYILFQDTGTAINEFRTTLPIGSCAEPLATPCLVTIAGTPAFSTPVNFNIYADPAHTVLGDTVSIFVNQNTNIEVDVLSGAAATVLGDGATNLTETGGIQDLFTINLAEQFITPLDIEIQTDAGAPNAVPEPSSLLLLAAPFAAAMAFRRRLTGRRQTAA